jgi:hypothetical protein
MIKQITWIVAEEMKCDAFSIFVQQDHDPDLLEKELKFLPDSSPLNYYLVNWGFGNYQVKKEDMGVIFL